jgi:hypothetical protein
MDDSWSHNPKGYSSLLSWLMTLVVTKTLVVRRSSDDPRMPSIN